MNKFSICIIPLCFALISACAPTLKDHTIEPGCITCMNEQGEMQCISEIDRNGNLAVLLKPTNEKTAVKFNNVKNHSRGGYIVDYVLISTQDLDYVKSWIDVKNFQVVINPVLVDNLTLTGDKVYESKNITVYTQGKPLKEIIGSDMPMFN